MHRALLELTIEGVETSRDFHLRVMEDDEFRAGAIEIQWLERRLASLLGQRAPASVERAAAIVAALLADRERHAPSRGKDSPPVPASPSATANDGWLRTARIDGLR
jgi:acetyl-CoA carboxylase biotin carboxylase subunit